MKIDSTYRWWPSEDKKEERPWGYKFIGMLNIGLLVPYFIFLGADRLRIPYGIWYEIAKWAFVALFVFMITAVLNDTVKSINKGRKFNWRNVLGIVILICGIYMTISFGYNPARTPFF